MNITLTNITEKQKEWLEKEAEKKGITITGLVKYWIENGIKRDDRNVQQDNSYYGGFWE